MSSAEPAAYEALARTIERELELLGEGCFDQLAALHAERAALIQSLPEAAPDWARPALQRAALMNKRLEIELLRHQEALLLELAQLERVSRAARGYAPPRRTGRHLEASA